MGNVLEKEAERFCGIDVLHCRRDEEDNNRNESARRGLAGDDNSWIHDGDQGHWQRTPAAQFTFKENNEQEMMRQSPAQLQQHLLASDDEGEDQTCARELHGVGIIFKMRRDGHMEVMAFIKSGDAFQSGAIQDGDQLFSINSIPVSGLSLEQVTSLLLGPEGSQVILKFLRPRDGKVMRDPEPVTKPVNQVQLDLGQISSHEKLLTSPISSNSDSSGLWKSSAMRSWAPTYESIVVAVKRKTGWGAMESAAEVARQRSAVNGTQIRGL